MAKNLVYLVNAPNDIGMAAIANYHTFPALGVLTLGTWLKQKIPGVDVVVRDGGVFPIGQIVEEISSLRPWIVGVSVLATSYQNSILLAQHAKDCGAYTVFGNDQASQLSQKILEKRSFVDFVLGSEYGEVPLELLVRSLRGEPIKLEKIPDLTYREKGNVKGFRFMRDRTLLSIVSSPAYLAGIRKNALDVFPVVDRSLYPEEHWRAYLRNYLKKYARLHQDRPLTGVTTINRARGCSRSKDAIKCKHCDVLLDVSFSSPRIFWEEVRTANEQVGSNIFYEVCDSLSSFPSFIRGLVKAKPTDLDFDPMFFVYAQAKDLVGNPDLTKQMRDLGVFRVNIGLESGSDITLKHMKGEHDSVTINHKALRQLKEFGIFAYGSLVLGTDPETAETLKETVDWAKRIIDEELVADIEAQPILPLPNNYYGRRLSESGFLTEEEKESDWPWDADRLSQLYVDNFSGVSFRDSVDASIEIREYARKKGIHFGSGVLKEAKYVKKQ